MFKELCLLIICIAVWILCYIWNHYVKVTKCKSDAKLFGKTAIVTGANSGIGLETTRELYRRGARVILACRDKNRAEKAVKYIISTTTCEKARGCEEGELVVYLLDLASLKSVREFCRQIKENEPRIHLLVNNAGIYKHPEQCTEDDLEIHMSVNHFGHFLLTNLLMDTLKSSAPSRIVVVGSFLYANGNIDFAKLKGEHLNPRAYADSKLANALFVRYFNLKHGPESGVSIYYADPGIVLTNIDRHTIPAFAQYYIHIILSALFKFPQEACQTILHCALSEEVESGCCYTDCSKQDWKDNVLDDGIAKKFWEISEDLTGLLN